MECVATREGRSDPFITLHVSAEWTEMLHVSVEWAGTCGSAERAGTAHVEDFSWMSINVAMCGSAGCKGEGLCKKQCNAWG